VKGLAVPRVWYACVSGLSAQVWPGEWSGAQVFYARDAVTTPAVVLDAIGGQHVFALSPGGTPRERVQAFPSSGWSPWVTLVGRLLVVPAGQPA
jgi:hypothetical protein